MRILMSAEQYVVDDILDQYPNFTEFLGWLPTPRTRLSFDRIAALGLPIGVDNACYNGFDESLFTQCVNRINCEIEWLVVPDKVGDCDWTRRSFDEWAPRLGEYPLGFVLQDGQKAEEVPWEDIECVFIGGTTEWKFSDSVKQMSDIARERGKWLHLGRVNSQKRLRYAYSLKCDSVDGTGYSKYSKSELLPALQFIDELHSQGRLF